MVSIAIACRKLVSMQERIATGQTVLLLKDKSKGNKVSNYRPITCLPFMWKLLTGMKSRMAVVEIVEVKRNGR